MKIICAINHPRLYFRLATYSTITITLLPGLALNDTGKVLNCPVWANFLRVLLFKRCTSISTFSQQWNWWIKCNTNWNMCRLDCKTTIFLVCFPCGFVHMVKQSVFLLVFCCLSWDQPSLQQFKVSSSPSNKPPPLNRDPISYRGKKGGKDKRVREPEKQWEKTDLLVCF